MELNKLELQSERGKECRDMINILISLGYSPEAVINYICNNFKAEPFNGTDLETIKSKIERII